MASTDPTYVSATPVDGQRIAPKSTACAESSEGDDHWERLRQIQFSRSGPAPPDREPGHRRGLDETETILAFIVAPLTLPVIVAGLAFPAIGVVGVTIAVALIVFGIIRWVRRFGDPRYAKRPFDEP